MTDSVVKAVVEKFLQRSELGQKKYGTTLDRTDLGTLDWINHAQEEFMDGILYLERLKRCFQPLKNEIVDDRPSPPSSSESEEHDNSDSELPIHPAENFIIVGGKKRPRPENYADVEPMKKRAKQQKSVSTESRHSGPSLSSESAKSEVQVLKSCAAQARRCGEKL